MTDAYIVAACLDVLDMEKMDSDTNVKTPIHLMSDDQKVKFVEALAKVFLTVLQ